MSFLICCTHKKSIYYV